MSPPGRCTDTSGVTARMQQRGHWSCVVSGSRRARSGSKKQPCDAISARSADEIPKGRRPLRDPSGRECLNAGQSAEASKQTRMPQSREQRIQFWLGHPREKCFWSRSPPGILSVMMEPQCMWGVAANLRGCNQHLYFFSATIGVDHASDGCAF